MEMHVLYALFAAEPGAWASAALGRLRGGGVRIAAQVPKRGSPRAARPKVPRRDRPSRSKPSDECRRDKRHVQGRAKRPDMNRV